MTEPTPEQHTAQVAGYVRASQMRPVSWSDPRALPSPGCWCSCCKGQRWWCEVTEPKGWRCATCHPPGDEAVQMVDSGRPA